MTNKEQINETVSQMLGMPVRLFDVKSKKGYWTIVPRDNTYVEILVKETSTGFTMKMVRNIHKSTGRVESDEPFIVKFDRKGKRKK